MLRVSLTRPLVTRHFSTTLSRRSIPPKSSAESPESNELNTPEIASPSNLPSPERQQKILDEILDKKSSPFQEDLDAFTQRVREWRDQALVSFRNRADEFTAKSKVTFSQLGSELNRVTGYEVIDALKREVVEQEARIHTTRQAARQAKQAYDEAVAQRSNSQREVNDLLQRKSLWTDTDVGRFTTLVRQDHLYEQEETRTKAAVHEMENAVEREFSELMRTILARYHEEQVWSDKIRSASTYGQLAALGLNMFVFVMAIIIVEPWKRRRLAQTFEKKVEQLSQENEARVEASMAEIGAHLADQERLILHLRDVTHGLLTPPSVETPPPAEEFQVKQDVVVPNNDRVEEVHSGQVVTTIQLTRGILELAAVATGAFVFGVASSLLFSR
ncbi:hypothetical protein E4T56_gene1980 [Termitomyces sp. T112]|nr:hypothetical protein E4T56_gene1980 [Termitomyces sp. T112]KAH0586140.1 hypothetical protein H2248_007406 [Termitomyces sp. 'cryptogamus']